MSIPWNNLKRINEWQEQQAKSEQGKEPVSPKQQLDLFSPTHSIGNFGNLNENAFFWLLMLRMSQTPKGMEIVADTIKGIVGAFERALSGYCRSGSANMVAAWGSGRLLSQFMERFGFITQMQAAEFNSGLSIITGAKIAEGFADTVQGFFPFSNPEPSEYPTTVNLGDEISIRGKSQSLDIPALLTQAKALKEDSE